MNQRERFQVVDRIESKGAYRHHVVSGSAAIVSAAGEHSSDSEDSAIWQVNSLSRRRKRRFLTLLEYAGALSLGIGSVLAAYIMLYSWPESMQPFTRTLRNLIPSVLKMVSAPEFAFFVKFLVLSPIVYLFVFQRLHVLGGAASNIIPFHSTVRILQGTIVSTIAIIAFGFTLSGIEASTAPDYLPLYFTYQSLLMFFGVLLMHSGLLTVTLILQLFDIGRSRVAVVSGGAGSSALLTALREPSSEYNLVGTIRPEAGDESSGSAPQFLGALDELHQVINEHDLDEIILAVDLGALTMEQRFSIAQICWRMGVELRMVAPFYPFFHTGTRPQQIGGVSLLNIEKVGLYARWPQLIKRAMDILISLTALVASTPVLLLAITAIKLDSAGPVFFRQKRVGLYGRTFRMLKLRSMLHNADPEIHKKYLEQLIQNGTASEVDKDGKPIYKLTNDPRITRVGGFIRKTSIDELPQLMNVLRGEMSLVGPRPPLQYEVDQYKDWHYKRLNIRPGITGMWQVGGRSRLSYEDMIRLDIDYIENWSLWMDIKILLKTVPVVLKIGQSY